MASDTSFSVHWLFINKLKDCLLTVHLFVFVYTKILLNFIFPALLMQN